MKNLSRISLSLLLALFFVTGCEKEDDSPLESAAYQELNGAMRDLWTDHVVWTRNVIINVMDGAPGTTEAVNRLLKNQEDLGNAIKPYYGDAAGDALTVLLKEHITIAADLLTAAKSGDDPAFSTANTAWQANANEIAAFLNTANPDHWPLDHMQAMMKSHLDLTLEQAVARLNQDYDADVAAFDKVFDEIIEMADMLSEGIALQFPDKF
jgi:hypothetical protein